MSDKVRIFTYLHLVIEQYCDEETKRYSGFDVTWNKTQIGDKVVAHCTAPGLKGQINNCGNEQTTIATSV